MKDRLRGKRRGVRRGGVLLFFGLSALMVPAGAWANHVSPVQVAGNPSCQDLDQNYGEVWEQFKIDTGAAGTYPVNQDGLTGTVTINTQTNTVSFNITPGIDAIIIKGGPEGANIYVYDPDEDADSGLHVPSGSTSHVSVCYNLTGTISGTKWHDLDADGVKDGGEPVLAGWKIYLDLNDNDARDANEPIATTNASGVYSFSDLAFGSYSVRELPAAQQPNSSLTECSFPSGCEHDFTLTQQARTATGDFGNYANGKIEIDKVTTGAGADQEHDFGFSTVAFGAGFSLDGNDAVKSFTVKPNLTGAYQVTEGDDALYTLTGLDCDDSDSTQDGDGSLRTATIKVQSGETVRCTFTNTRKTGRIELVKSLVPANDPGRFNLSIAGVAQVSDVGDGGTTQEQTVPTGAYDVGESAGAGTSLADYNSSIVCKDGDAVVKQGSGTSLDDVPVGEGDDVVCTITNTRKTGKLEVVKDLVPADDPGRFNLLIDGASPNPGSQNVGDGGSTGEQTVNTGTHTVGETAGAGTSLADYNSSIECKDGDQVVVPASSGTSADVNVTDGSDIVCTITNARKTGRIELVKSLVPANDPGRFNLSIAGVAQVSDVGHGGTTQEQTVPTGAYDVGETAGTGTSLASYTSSIVCRDGDTIVGQGSGTSLDDVPVGEGDDVVCTITNTRLNPDIELDKKLRVQGVGAFVEGPIQVYIGDTIEYRFVATNPGDVELHDVTLTDPRCDAGTLTGPDPAGDTDSDGNLDVGEAWTWTCTHSVTAASGDPVHNVAVVTGKGPDDQEVDDSDEEDADVLHPAIDIEKAGPATAEAGQRIPYNLTVTNPGDVAIVGQTLAVTDPLCDAPPVLVSKARGGGADASPETLDPGDSWLYTCFVPTQVGQTSVLNTGRADGEDLNGRKVSDTDDFPTTLTQPQGGTLPDTVVSGAARLRGPSRCVSKRFRVRVTGRRIQSVVWKIDGRRVKTFRSRKGEARRVTLRVKPRRYGPGLHRLTARIRFNSASRTKARTLRMTFQRCARRLVRPNFTG